jgi:hypothetical protein
MMDRAKFVKALTPSMKTIEAVAPTVALALGGPIPGLAVSMLTKALSLMTMILGACRA